MEFTKLPKDEVLTICC